MGLPYGFDEKEIRTSRVNRRTLKELYHSRKEEEMRTIRKKGDT